MMAEQDIQLSPEVTLRIAARTKEAGQASTSKDSTGGTDATAFDIWECSVHLARYLLHNGSLVVRDMWLQLRLKLAFRYLLSITTRSVTFYCGCVADVQIVIRCTESAMDRIFPMRQAGKRVLEIGCGVGALPGIACGLASQPAGEITLSDYDPAALRLAASNARANGVECSTLLLDFNAPPR